jgi:hemerythrin superfamily protein
MLKRTTEPETIRRWAAQRQGTPARLRDDRGSSQLVIRFADGLPRGPMEDLSWDDFLRELKDQQLTFLYLETTRRGRRSRYHKVAAAGELAAVAAQGRRRLQSTFNRVSAQTYSWARQVRQSRAAKITTAWAERVAQEASPRRLAEHVQHGGRWIGLQALTGWQELRKLGHRLPHRLVRSGPRTLSPHERDPFAILQFQHDEVDRRFDELAKDVQSDERRRRFLAVADLLSLHTLIEEKSFYPGALKPETEALLARAEEDHQEMKRILSELVDREPTDPVFEPLLTDLESIVEAHVWQEETEVFPKVQALMTAEERDRIGREMRQLLDEAAATETPAAEPQPVMPT